MVGETRKNPPKMPMERSPPRNIYQKRLEAKEDRVTIPSNIMNVLFDNQKERETEKMDFNDVSKKGPNTNDKLLADRKSTTNQGQEAEEDTDPEIFETVDASRRKRRRRATSDDINDNAAVAVSNKYGPLNTLPTEGRDIPSQEINKAPRAKWPPAIVIKKILNPTQLVRKIRDIVIDKSFTFRKLNGEDGSRLQLKNKEDYRKVNIFLEQSGAQKHTWAPKGEGVLRYVIHGLDEGIDPEFIKEELNSLTVPCVAVKIISPNNKDIYVATVQRSKEFDPKGIEKINSICNHLVKIVAFKYKTPQRCYRCNAYRHGSRFCTASPRCYYCAGDHEGKDCKERETIKCCNCGGKHPAYSKECTVYQKEQQVVDEGRVKRRQKSRGRNSKNGSIDKKEVNVTVEEKSLDDTVKKTHKITKGKTYANVTKNTPEIPSDNPQTRRELEYQRRNKRKGENKSEKSRSPEGERKDCNGEENEIKKKTKEKAKERRKAQRIKEMESDGAGSASNDIKSIVEAMTTMSKMFMTQMTIMQGMLQKMSEMFLTFTTNNGSKP